MTRTIPPGLIGGRLEGISIPDLLWRLSDAGSTGVLQVTHDRVTKKVHVSDGNVIFASSDDPDDRLGEMLLRQGLIDLDQLERASLRLAGSGKRLGTLLVEVAAITPRDLVQGVVDQVKEIILSLFSLEEGEYEFEEGPLPGEEVITLDMKTGQLLLEGVRRVRSFSRIRRSVGPPRTHYRLTDRWEGATEGLGLGEGERTLLRLLTGRGRCVSDLCQELFLSNFEIYQALWALKVVGAIEEGDRTASITGEASIEGRIGADGIAPVIVRLCREGLTGVLHVSRGPIDRAIHIRGGYCIFATSSNTDDGLVAHLLRRGVISLRDREETARRLLTNRRVGTILQEMGVIDERDLEKMVRQQLAEILFDTIAWDQGEYAFVEGPLPSDESITLETSIEAIVLAGVQRVVAWTRVLAGCGGLDATLRLTPRYLQVLDRMGVSQEEWEVISRLREPRTVRQICQDSRLGDFAVCQILWALRLLDAAEVISEAELVVAEFVRASEEPASASVVDEIAPPAAPLLVDETEDSLDSVAPAEADREEIQGPVVASADLVSESCHTAAAPAEAMEPERFALEAEVATGATPSQETTDDSASRAESGAEEPSWEVSPREDASDAGREDEAPPEAETPPLDSPLDATLYAPREEIESESVEAPAFEVVSPEELTEGPSEGAGVEAGEEVPAETTQTTRLSREEVEAALVDGPLSEPDGDSAAEQDPDADSVLEQTSAAASTDGFDEPRSEKEFETDEEGLTPAEPDWEPPADLEEDIRRFNAMQRVLFHSIRSEVGAGAVNFIRACGGCLGDPLANLLADVDLHPDGAWDPTGLRRALTENRVEQPWGSLQRVLDEEIDRLRVHIGDGRAALLRDKMEAADERRTD